MPYFKSKLHSIYNKEREAQLQASLWGHGDDRFGDMDYFDQGESSIVSSRTSDSDMSTTARLRKRMQKVVGACYPWIHASSEGRS